MKLPFGKKPKSKNAVPDLDMANIPQTPTQPNLTMVEKIVAKEIEWL